MFRTKRGWIRVFVIAANPFSSPSTSRPLSPTPTFAARALSTSIDSIFNISASDSAKDLKNPSGRYPQTLERVPPPPSYFLGGFLSSHPSFRPACLPKDAYTSQVPPSLVSIDPNRPSLSILAVLGPFPFPLFLPRDPFARPPPLLSHSSRRDDHVCLRRPRGG